MTSSFLADGWGMTGACSVIVIVGTLASLASLASSIVVYKDWIAIMADGDSNLLAGTFSLSNSQYGYYQCFTLIADMNSTCRSIDLATNMIAPIAVGQVMYFLSHIAAAVAIASWNAVSFLVEYILLWKIYQQYPNLADKKAVDKRKAGAEEEPLNEGDSAKQTRNEGDESRVRSNECRTDSFLQAGGNLTVRLGGIFKSWRIFMGHEVRNAGIGLGCLYMTVLGFDSITTGYAYSQGVPESLLGLILAAGAGVGLLGSITFPALVRCMGVERTGKKTLINYSKQKLISRSFGC